MIRREQIEKYTPCWKISAWVVMVVLVVGTLGCLLGGDVALAPECPAEMPVATGGGGGLIAFASNRDGNYEIYVMNVDGSQQRRLTNSDKDDRLPRWSPDGKRIAFTSRCDDLGRNYDIFVINADGSGPMRLTDNDRHDGSPAWSPDGTQIAFSSNRDGYFEIYVMDVPDRPDDDVTEPMRLTYHDDHDGWPNWSPDGTQIAFTSNLGGNSGIFVINADGSGLKCLADEKNMDESGPQWSPDGSQIAYSSGKIMRDYYIYVMNADGTGPTRLRKYSSGGFAWSPDWSRIAFAEGNDIYVMSADGSDLMRLGAHAPFGSLAWSPDGSWIVYVADDESSEGLAVGEIYVANSGCLGHKRLTNNSKDDRDPVWQP